MILFRERICFLLTLLGLVSANTIPSIRNVPVPASRSNSILKGLHSTATATATATTISNEEHLSFVLSIRGGASKSKRKSKSASIRSSSSSSSSKKKRKTATGNIAVGAGTGGQEAGAFATSYAKYRSVLPLTRLYITAIVIVTALSLLLGEEESQALLALDPIRTFYGFEFWRPFSAASFLGSPSISLLMSGYYLFEYGSSLERAFGTAQHTVFVLGQIVLLTGLSALLTQPFFGQSIITAMLHVLSRSMPNQKVKWLVFTVPYWSLPYGLMISDVLQAKNMMAALPHIMGILTGHVYYFHKFVWPKLGGEDWLVPPEFLVRKFEPDTRKDKINAALEKAKKRKKGKGRKLGS